jgi:hypothetical protein
MRFCHLLLLCLSLSSIQLARCVEYVSFEELSESGEPLESSYGSELSVPAWHQSLDVAGSPLEMPFQLSGKMLKPKVENLEMLEPLKEVRQLQFSGEKEKVYNIPLEQLPMEYLPERKLEDIHRDSKSAETLQVIRIPSKSMKQAPAEYLPTITDNEYHPQSQTFKEISHQNIIVDRRFVQPIVKEQQYEIPVYQRIVTQPIFQKRHFTQPIVEQKTFIQPIITPQLHKAPSYQRRMITLREVAKPKKELTQETLPVKVVQITKNAQLPVSQNFSTIEQEE